MLRSLARLYGNSISWRYNEITTQSLSATCKISYTYCEMLFLNPRVISLSFAFASCVSSQWCIPQTFGRPNPDDCAAVLDVLPQEHPAVDQHTFVEPPFLEPPFASVVDDVGHGIVQIPKIWLVSEYSSALRRQEIEKLKVA